MKRNMYPAKKNVFGNFVAEYTLLYVSAMTKRDDPCQFFEVTPMKWSFLTGVVKEGTNLRVCRYVPHIFDGI